MIPDAQPTAECTVLARAALRHLDAHRVSEAVAALEEAWRSCRELEWLLDVREDLLRSDGNRNLQRAATELRQRLPADLPSVAVAIASGTPDRIKATRAALASNGACVETLEARLLPSGHPDWNEAVKRASSPLVLLLEAGDCPGPGLLDRLVERTLRHPERSLVVSVPGWHGGIKLPEPGLAPLQILWAGGPARWSAFSRELWLRSGGLDPSLGRLAWRHLWMRMFSLGATGDRLAFDRIALANPPVQAGEEPWEALLERVAMSPDLRGRVGRLFLHEVRQFLSDKDDPRAIAPLRAASALLPDREDLRKMLATLDAGLDHLQPQEAMSRAGALVQAGQLDQAQDLLEKAAKRWPDSPETSHSLAWVLLQAGRASEAEQILRETARRFPDDQISRECLMEIDRASGRSDSPRAQDPGSDRAGEPPSLAAGHRKEHT